MLDVGAVIWATGFRPDHSWVNAPIFDDQHRVVHRRGVTDSPGLYFLGLTWQHTRGSALLGFVKDDAEYLAAQMRAFSPQRGGGPAGAEAGKDAATTPTRGGITPQLVR